MKRQELDQLRQKSKAELLKDMEAVRKELVTLRMTKGQQVLANVKLQGLARRKLAVLQTFVQMKGK